MPPAPSGPGLQAQQPALRPGIGQPGAPAGTPRLEGQAVRGEWRSPGSQGRERSLPGPTVPMPGIRLTACGQRPWGTDAACRAPQPHLPPTSGLAFASPSSRLCAPQLPLLPPPLCLQGFPVGDHLSPPRRLPWLLGRSRLGALCSWAGWKDQKEVETRELGPPVPAPRPGTWHLSWASAQLTAGGQEAAAGGRAPLSTGHTGISPRRVPQRRGPEGGEAAWARLAPQGLTTQALARPSVFSPPGPPGAAGGPPGSRCAEQAVRPA